MLLARTVPRVRLAHLILTVHVDLRARFAGGSTPPIMIGLRWKSVPSGTLWSSATMALLLISRADHER